jgi:transcriptional regulator with XRE-family HTH domain
LHWSQSELARKASDSRDNISNYVRRRALPEPQRLAKLAAVLGVEPDWLIPPGTPASHRDVEAFDAKQLSSNRVRLRINQVVSWDTFVAIAAALKEDENMGNADKN